MSTLNFFRDLALRKAKKQKKVIDALTEDSPIIEMMPMQEASAGLQHMYEELKDVTGAKVVNLDSELPLIDSNGELKYQDLSVLGGIMQVGQDKAKKFGGAVKYFLSKIVNVFKVSAMNIEKSLIYQTMLPFALASGNQQKAGGTNNVNYSMVAVRWVEGETAGLYDPEGFGKGKVFDVVKLDGGNVTIIETEAGKKIPGYRTMIKSYIGFLFANGRNVASIRDIDLTPAGTATGFTALPTEIQIDNMLEACRANPSDTFIYCHPRVLNALKVYKGEALQMSPTDKDFNRMVHHWDGIRFVTSRNFKQASEANA